MAQIGRNNVHGKGGVRFKTGWTASREKAMQRNVVTELIVHGHVTVTSGVVKQLTKNADHLITLAKQNDVPARREAMKMLRKVVIDEEKGTTALDKLFNELGPKFANRNGGYTRFYKCVERRGDGATPVIVCWVD